MHFGNRYEDYKISYEDTETEIKVIIQIVVSNEDLLSKNISI